MSDNANNKSLPPETHQDQKGLNKTQKILIAGFAAIIAVIIIVGIVLYYFFQKTPPTQQALARTNYVVNEDNLEEVLNEREVSAANNMFRLKMNTTWNFDSAKEASRDANVANSKTNRRPFFIEVSLADTGEIVYTSDVIPVGYAIKDIILDKELPPGDYSAICKYNMLNQNDEITNSFNIEMNLVIQN